MHRELGLCAGSGALIQRHRLSAATQAVQCLGAPVERGLVARRHLQLSAEICKGSGIQMLLQLDDAEVVMDKWHRRGRHSPRSQLGVCLLTLAFALIELTESDEIPGVARISRLPGLIIALSRPVGARTQCDVAGPIVYDRVGRIRRNCFLG